MGLTQDEALQFWRTEFTKKMDGDKFEKLMLGAPYSRPLDSKGSYYAKPFSDDQRVMVDYEVTSIDDLEGTMDYLINQIDDHKGNQLHYSSLSSNL